MAHEHVYPKEVASRPTSFRTNSRGSDLSSTPQHPPTDPVGRLAAASAVLFREDAWPDQLRSATHDLHSLFSKLTGIGDDTVEHDQHTTETVLNSGTAISPHSAAMCLIDFQRTTQFLRGTDAAVRAVQDRFPGRTIELLYAGCGPYATLAIPLCTRYSPDEVRFTLADVHETSLTAVGKIVDAVGLNGYFAEYVQCDISSYRHPAEPPHLVVCEAMQKALDKEPQVAATLNLAPQLRTGGVFLPQRVTIELCMADLGREISLESSRSQATDAPRDRMPVQRLLDLSQSTAPVLADALESGNDGKSQVLPATIVRVPALPSGQYTATLLTHVSVFGTLSLGDYDSGISTPKALHELGLLRGGELLEFQYVLGSDPGFMCQRVG